MRASLALLALLASACADPGLRIVNHSAYPTDFASAVIASVKANAAPELDLTGYTLNMRSSYDTLVGCHEAGGCINYSSQDIEVPFDSHQEVPYTHPNVDAWIIDTLCHELGHAYLFQTTGDGGIRTDDEGNLYHETEGVYGEWFNWPREKCLPPINEFGGFGNQ